MILPGSYVEYLHDKRLVSAVCLRQDKPGRVFVRNDRGREEKLAENKALFPVAGFISLSTSYEDIATLLSQQAQNRQELADSISVHELWELLLDEERSLPWNLSELSELVLGDSQSASLSATYRALEADRVYFVRKSEGYALRTAQQVDEIVLQQQMEAQGKLERSAVVSWLAKVWVTMPGSSPVAMPTGYEQACERALQWFAEVAILGVESKRSKDVQALLKDVEVTRKDAPFRFLIKAGVWQEHENLLLHKFNIDTDFSEAVSVDAEQLVQDTEFDDEPGRLDLQNLECVSVDDVYTTEIDDAISFEEYPDGGCRLGIHIADASQWVKSGSLVDQEAQTRATAIYLPDLKIRMLPVSLAEQACSLVANQVRPAFSFLATFDAQFNKLSVQMSPSKVIVKQRLSYAEVDQQIEQGKWARLMELARHLLAERKSHGAMTVPFPRINVSVNAECQVSIERESPVTPAQIMISEAMILANRSAGEYFAEHEIPAIFRCQEPPEKPIEEMEQFDPVKAYACRRYLRKGTMQMACARHNGLGLEFYTQVTSPIRRYNDLLMQRQLKHHLLTGLPYYTAEELEQKLLVTKAAANNADLVERDRRSYWIMRYLEERLWQEVEAVVVANHPDKHIIQLVDCLWETECALVPGHPMPAGTRLLVRIELVWPRDSTVRVTPVV